MAPVHPGTPLEGSLLIRDKVLGRRVPLLELRGTAGAGAIVDAHQIETSRRCHRTARRSVASAEGCGQVGRRPLTVADQLQRANHRTYLVVQEGAGRGLNMDLFSHPMQREAIQGLDGRLGLASGGTKGCEVVTANKRRGSRGHAFYLQPPRHPPNPVAIEDGRRGAHENTVAVVARERTAPRIETVGGKVAVEYRDGFGLEVKIDGRPHGSGRPIPGQIEVGDLSQRVYSSVGAPGTVHRDVFTRQAIDRLGQPPLHRYANRLHLPAHEGGAVIFECYAVAWHSRPVAGASRKMAAPSASTSPSLGNRQAFGCRCKSRPRSGLRAPK